MPIQLGADVADEGWVPQTKFRAREIPVGQNSGRGVGGRSKACTGPVRV
jgi:hypothetical protein